ncbi:uncharacterized protein LOC9659618 [Selaginella moellendorffii]|uniref:uncharacterized protein LOC9659618 n=1 Tax=Selaginella moellendorffii TaxID=88036 RepID=UPI000D1C5611|nr:uncharacterized protein LOC9659618 [Selaginella moellendorffii]|eukprot:XP_024525665.1 uncharacterized protein LOC9659618 [Selaginella moellendorffii]
MKSQFEELQNICDSQHEEITLLRRDVRISHQREIEMEKDVFVEEIAKLQKDVKKLKLVHSQLCCETKDLCCMRDKAGDMEVLNYHLENCMEVVLKALDKANREIVAHRQKLTESSLLAKRSSKRCKDLEDQITLAKDCLEKEKLEKKNLEEKRVCLEAELVTVEEKLNARGLSLYPATPSPDKLAGSKPNSPRSARTV